VKNEKTIAQEEIFGPVLGVIAYDSEHEAIRIANDSKYGLHAAVIGTDLSRTYCVASQLRTGRVVINGTTDDPQAPLRGFKYYGVGRELVSTESRRSWNRGPSSKRLEPIDNAISSAAERRRHFVLIDSLMEMDVR
jgi:acyl-CoA reductase-like NAD-dependent aldehyde dehydrogenase